MAKNKTSIWKCDNKNCDYESKKYFGKCPKCSEGYGEEENIKNILRDNKGNLLDSSTIVNMEEAKPIVSIKNVETKDVKRINTGFQQLNRLFGGKGNNLGIMPNSINVIYGPPGVGKSTLLLQLMSNISKQNIKSCYISGEENPEQLKDRYDRLELDTDFDLSSEDNVLIIQDKMKDYDFLIVDSINTMIKPGVGTLGGVSQLKECSLFFQHFAKTENKTIILIAQVNKTDELAGPQFFKHMVDALFIYSNLDENKKYKSITPDKNRFGNIQDTSILEMKEKGLKEILDPSFIFTNSDENDENIFGSSLGLILKGQRPVFIEIDSLVVETNAEIGFLNPVGIDRNKFSQLNAIISKYLGILTYKMNIYSAITGGLKLPNEPQLDLPIIASILSSMKQKNIKKFIFLGEVSLNGSIKKIQNEEYFLEHCKKMKINKKIICNTNGQKHIKDIMSYFD